MAVDPAAEQRELDERRLQVISEQATGLRWPITIIASIISVIAWTAVPKPWIVIWFLLTIGCREARDFALAQMAKDRDTPISIRLRRTVWWNAVLGAANGSAATFIIWLDPTLDAILTMIVVCWGAGAVSASATVFPAFLAYAGMMFVPTAFLWGLQGTWLSTGVALMVLMFYRVQTGFAKRNWQTFEESFRIRLENVALARSLDVERGELAIARDAAVSANMEKSRFLAAASHDLRQPLQAMSLNTGALVRLPIDPEAQTIAREIATSVDELRNMLDGLLDVSQLDGGAVVPHFRPVALERLLEGVIGSFRAAAAARQLFLTWDCPQDVSVHTDPDLLRRILSNLIDNGIKFTHTGGIDIRVIADNERVEIVVTDTGQGIPESDHQRIFEDLVQLGNPERARSQGHGLGLGIVRRLVALLGIRITLDSAPGKGSTFKLAMAKGDLPTRAMPAPSADISPLAGRRILVLEDDPAVRVAYQTSLGGLGCNVSVASTIAAAETICAQSDLDALVVDYRLRNGEDGVSAIDRLRGLRPGLPAVLVSADIDPHITDGARQRGVGFLRKPVEGVALERALLALFEGCE